jgi:hypothetical protein
VKRFGSFSGSGGMIIFANYTVLKARVVDTRSAGVHSYVYWANCQGEVDVMGMAKSLGRYRKTCALSKFPPLLERFVGKWIQYESQGNWSVRDAGMRVTGEVYRRARGVDVVDVVTKSRWFPAPLPPCYRDTLKVAILSAEEERCCGHHAPYSVIHTSSRERSCSRQCLASLHEQ